MDSEIPTHATEKAGGEESKLEAVVTSNRSGFDRGIEVKKAVSFNRKERV
jgi:hypothetical protein